MPKSVEHKQIKKKPVKNAQGEVVEKGEVIITTTISDKVPEVATEILRAKYRKMQEG